MLYYQYIEGGNLR